MTYACADCSYRGKKSGRSGECPACGSFNLTNHRLSADDKKPPARWRLVVLMLLWGYLGAMIIWKLLH